MRAFAASPETAAGRRSQFIANVTALFDDLRLFILPSISDTSTSPDVSRHNRTATWNQTPVLSAQGLGYLVVLDGDNDYFSIADANDLSFGNGTADEAFSMIWFGQVNNTASVRYLMAKDNGSTAREYNLKIEGDDKLTMALHDESANAEENKTSNAAITQDSLHMFAGVYSAATGGTSADSDITLYADGAAVSATGGATGTYVAMEDLATAFTMGVNSIANNDLGGFFGFCILAGEAVTADKMWTLKSLVNAYYGTSL